MARQATVERHPDMKNDDAIDLDPSARERAPLRAAAWVSVVLALTALLSALFSRAVYDKVIPTHSRASLYALAIGMGAALAVDFALRILRSRWIEASGEAFDARVAEELFARLLGTRMPAMPRAAVATSMFREFEAVRDLHSTATVTAVVDAASTVLFLAVLAAMTGPLALVTLAGMSALLASWLLQNAVASRSRRAMPTSVAKQALLHEAAMGAEDVKLARAEGRLAAEMGRLTARAAEDGAAIRWLGSLVNTVVGSASMVVQAAVLSLGSLLVIDGSITMGTLIAASILSGRAMAPCSSLAAVALKVGRARSSALAVRSLADAPKEYRAGLVVPASCAGHVRFEGVRFHYPGREAPALDGFDLDVAPGEIVAVIGPRGCGKSTLGRLLAGLAETDPSRDSGSVLLDGIPVSQIDRGALRGFVGVCPQDPVLFTRSIRDNIAFARPDGDDADVLMAARLACADDWITRLPRGFGSEVVEQGRTLSGGERQSVGLARTLMGNPAVIFLDEPTAHFDPVATRRFVANMGIFLRGRTAIIATHRPEILSVCTRVVAMERGKVVASRSPAEVLAAFAAQPAVQGRG